MKPAEAYPLCWPAGRARTKSRKGSNFGGRGAWGADGYSAPPKLSFARARDELLAELSRLGAKSVVLSTNIELRQDGLPYSNRRQPDDPGVAVYFQLRGRPMVFACDLWTKVEDNAWAIMKTINAMRGIARWGSGDMLERAFTGFSALPPPMTTPAPRPWREVLGVGSSVPLSAIEKQYRDLAFKNHPDRGGNPARMAEINRAWEEAQKEHA